MQKIKKALVEVDNNLRKIVKPLPEESLSFFKWTVFNEYTIEERLEPDEDDPDVSVIVKYVVAQDSFREENKTIEPLEGFPGLYNDFVKIDCEESLMAFVHKFGLLTNEREERLDTIVRYTFEIRYCLKLYAAIKDGSMENEYWNNHLEELEAGKIFTQEDKETQALCAITNHINKHIKGSHPFFVVRDKKIHHYNTCDNLLAAIYLQIYEKISEKQELIECKECKSLFFPTRKGQQYCPPLYGEKKSLCLNRKSVRESRERGLK